MSHTFTIPQTDYALYFNEAILGMQALVAELAKKVSRIASGIVYYGRAVVQSRLYDGVCRMPRSNKIVITDDAGTLTAGTAAITSVIAYGTLANGEVAQEIVATKTVVTAYASSKNQTFTNHAANIKAAIADCYSCAYDSSAHTITYVGDCFDIISSATTFAATGYGDTLAASPTSEVISSADVAADIIGISYLTHNRQQQIAASTNGGLTYYMDTEPVNICQAGTIWVYTAATDAAPNKTVYAQVIKDSTKYAGLFMTDADSSKAVALAGAKFEKTLTAAGLVPLTINLPQ